MDYISEVKKFLAKQPASVKKDQFFLIDPQVLADLVACAKITKTDRVFEVGTGLGSVTMALAKKAKSVLTIEVDNQFHKYHHDMPKNVKVIYGDAYKLLNNTAFHKSHKPPTKTVSSIPYSQAQNMLHNYTNWPWYQGDVVWLAPISLAEKVNAEPILGAYFKAKVIREVPKAAFLPQPNTTSAIIYFRRIENPIKTGNLEIYWRRWLYNHEEMKVKKAIYEGIIRAGKDLYKKVITKKQAKEIFNALEIPAEEHDKLTNNILPEYYFELPAKIKPFLG